MGASGRLAELSVEISANTATLRRALDQAEAQTRAFGARSGAAVNALSGAFRSASASISAAAISMAGAAVSLSAIGAYTKQSIADLAKVQDVAQRTGASAGFIQAFGYAVRQSGGEIEDATKGLQRFSIGISKAASGGGDLAKVFAANGIAVRDAGGQLRSLEDLLGEYANLIKNAGSEQDAMNLAAMAFGRSAGPALVLALAEGKSGLDDLYAAARKAGVVVGDELVKQAAALDDQFATLEDSISGVSKSLAVEFAGPAVKAGLDETLGFLTRIREEIEAIRGLDVARIGQALAERTGPGYLMSRMDGGEKDERAELQRKEASIRARIAVAENRVAAASAAGRTATGSEEQIAKLKADLADVQKRIAAINANPVKPVDGLTPTRAGYTAAAKATVIPETEKNEYQREIESIQQKVLALRSEAVTFGQSVQAATAYRTEQELLAAASRANLKITPELTRDIKRQADELARATAETDRLKQARQDAQQDLQTRQRLRGDQEDLALIGAGTKAIETARYARERLFEIERQAAENGAEWARQRKQGLEQEAALIGSLAEKAKQADLIRDAVFARQQAPRGPRQHHDAMTISLEAMQ